jgi:hypothetical protein
MVSQGEALVPKDDLSWLRGHGAAAPGRDAAGRIETFTVPEHRLWDSRVLLAILEEPRQ